MKKIYLLATLLGALTWTTSCSDFFEVDSEHVIFDDQEHLDNATDTIYSLVGILNKLQAVGDRTILLGEMRGDLVDVTDATSSDLRDLAMYNVSDNNVYNSPRDYYSVINNCNYYIAHVDTAMKNNRNEYLFRSEYAVVKAVRAWTYLQLVTTYGKVPFVTDPILTKEQSEREYPMKDIAGICDYFINQDGLQGLVDVPYPQLGDIKGMPSRMFYVPISIILGDLNLWAGNYLEAARCYYSYISKRNGTNSTYATGVSMAQWSSAQWDRTSTSDWLSHLIDESYSPQSEIITMIPGDSIPSEGYYSQLRQLFNSSYENNQNPSIVPSEAIINISESQRYCLALSNGDVMYAPGNLSEHRSGDLRLSAAWRTYRSYNNDGNMVEAQAIGKYVLGNIHIYRRTLIYLRMAEALNRAGYPVFAFKILSSGVNNRVITNEVIPYYRADSLLLTQFDFPSTRYLVYDPISNSTSVNTIGIHTRGSGFSPYNEFYQMPYNEAITDSLEQIRWQQEAVENLIMDEEALEFAFEGYRYYDLMRVALRRADPSYFADHIYGRRGEDRKAEMRSQIPVDLNNQNNWFLRWNGKIGL